MTILARQKVGAADICYDHGTDGGVTAAAGFPLPWIVLVSNPRSGTTHALRLMEVLRGLFACREEWLNIKGVPWVSDPMLARLRAAHGVDYAQHKDPVLGAWTRADFHRVLSFAQTAAPKGTQAAVVKVLFPDLTVPEFSDLFLTNPANMVLVMQRAPIDSFISLMKAREVDKWLDHDTTDLRVTLDPEAFLLAWEEEAAWYRGLRSALERHKRPYGLLHYDRDILPGEDRALSRLIEELGRAGFATRLKPKPLLKRQAQRVLATAAAALGGKAVALRSIGLQKQDRESSREAKVANWGSFIDRVRRHPAGEARMESYGVWD